MESSRVVGAVALGALTVAAISFGVVHASIAIVNGCAGSSDPCQTSVVPPAAISFSALAYLCLAVCTIPAVQWIVASIARSRDTSADLEAARRVRRRTFADVVDE